MRMVGDSLAYMKSLGCISFNTVILDPPDNIGFKYSYYDDNRPAAEYYPWLGRLITEAKRVSNTVWVSVYRTHLDYVLSNGPYLGTPGKAWDARLFIWCWEFGNDQSAREGITSLFRPIIRLSRPGVTYKYGKSWEVPTYRASVGDRRVATAKNERARNGMKLCGDVWSVPRICNNSREYTGYGNQHPELVYKRMMDYETSYHVSQGNGIMSGVTMSSTLADVFDAFGGSGTGERAAASLGCTIISMDINPEYSSIAQ